MLILSYFLPVFFLNIYLICGIFIYVCVSNLYLNIVEIYSYDKLFCTLTLCESGHIDTMKGHTLYSQGSPSLVGTLIIVHYDTVQ